MSSPPPLCFDTYYHIYNRGNNRENIFVEERNYLYFLQLYAKHLEPVADTFAYCLMRNHFHLLVRVKSEEEIRNIAPGEKISPQFPSKRFSDFFNAYAKAINNRYGRTGSLFQHPFGRVFVHDDRQFSNVVAYIHQNPQKHGFVEDFRDWRWSSYGIIPAKGSTKLQRDVILDWFGGEAQYQELNARWVENCAFSGEDAD